MVRSRKLDLNEAVDAYGNAPAANIQTSIETFFRQDDIEHKRLGFVIRSNTHAPLVQPKWARFGINRPKIDRAYAGGCQLGTNP